MLFPILDIISLRKKQEGKKMLVYFILEPARLLGAYKPGSRARMDSRTGDLPMTWVLKTGLIKKKNTNFRFSQSIGNCKTGPKL